MIAFLRRQEIAVWQFPERLEIMAELPRGVGGKVLKSSLTAWIVDRLKAEGVA
jgi:non-ribosomal peptide synthetase component E (peptide arylation enzyme)